MSDIQHKLFRGYVTDEPVYNTRNLFRLASELSRQCCTVFLVRSQQFGSWRSRILLRGSYVFSATIGSQRTDPLSVLLRTKFITKTQADLILKRSPNSSPQNVTQLLNTLGWTNDVNLVEAYIRDVQNTMFLLDSWKDAKYAICIEHLPVTIPPIEAPIRVSWLKRKDSNS